MFVFDSVPSSSTLMTGIVFPGESRNEIGLVVSEAEEMDSVVGSVGMSADMGGGCIGTALWPGWGLAIGFARGAARTEGPACEIEDIPGPRITPGGVVLGAGTGMYGGLGELP